MADTIFLNRDQYWREIEARMALANHAMAAIAYLGSGGSEFLPLRAGDKLVVDLSLGAVKQGVTDPREIKKLVKRGVEVYTRPSLHAKVVVIDKAVIVASANISKNARNYLDEAAILSTARSTVQAAKRFILAMCSEPVLDGYLKECLALYKPPLFKGARTARQPKGQKRRAKLWYIGGLVYIDAEKDRVHIEPLEEEAKKELFDPVHSEPDWIRLGYCPKWFSDIQRNNWVIDCTRVNKRTCEVGSPARVISKRRYKTKAGKTYHMLMLERPCDRENMSLTEFHRRWRHVTLKGHQPPKRSQAITDGSLADDVLKFWTRRGKVSRRGNS